MFVFWIGSVHMPHNTNPIMLVYTRPNAGTGICREFPMDEGVGRVGKPQRFQESRYRPTESLL